MNSDYENVLDSVVDHYIETMYSVPPDSAIPPSMKVCAGNFKPDSLVSVYVCESCYRGNVSHIQYYCADRPQKAKCFGKIPYSMYLTLEDRLDTALSEYRRKTFSRISHRERKSKVEAR